MESKLANAITVRIEMQGNAQPALQKPAPDPSKADRLRALIARRFASAPRDKTGVPFSRAATEPSAGG